MFFIGLSGGRGEYGYEGVCLILELCKVVFALVLLPPLQTLSFGRFTEQYHCAGSPVS